MKFERNRRRNGVAGGVQSGRLRARESAVHAFEEVEAAIVWVSTPSMPAGSVDVRPMMRVFGILAAAAEQVSSLRPAMVVRRSRQQC